MRLEEDCLEARTLGRERRPCSSSEISVLVLNLALFVAWLSEEVIEETPAEKRQERTVLLVRLRWISLLQ